MFSGKGQRRNPGSSITSKKNADIKLKISVKYIKSSYILLDKQTTFFIKIPTCYITG